MSQERDELRRQELEVTEPFDSHDHEWEKVDDWVICRICGEYSSDS